MHKILVTGGAGFIGSHTVVELLTAGYEPVIVDNFSNSEKWIIDRLKQITGRSLSVYGYDCLDMNSMEHVFKEHKISGIIHFAALKAVNESIQKPLLYYRNNLVSLINLLELARDHEVTDFVFSSSAIVYGEPAVLPITELSPLKPPASPYGATKQIGETIIVDTIQASKNLRALSLRYFNPIGAHTTGLIGELPLGVPNNLVPFVNQTGGGIRKKLTVHGNDYETPDGSCIRDYIHVVDLAKAHVAALRHLETQPSKYYDACNIGTGKGSSVFEVMNTFKEVTGQKLPYAVGPRREGDVPTCYADATKAGHLLNWQATLSLKDALQDAWRWQQSLAANKNN